MGIPGKARHSPEKSFWPCPASPDKAFSSLNVYFAALKAATKGSPWMGPSFTWMDQDPRGPWTRSPPRPCHPHQPRETGRGRPVFGRLLAACGFLALLRLRLENHRDNEPEHHRRRDPGRRRRQPAGKMPVRPSSVTAFRTPFASSAPNPVSGTVAPAPANSMSG